MKVRFRQIISNPKICHGKPCFKGTRILVSTILDSLASGEKIETLVKEYPPLKKQDILCAIEYASTFMKGEEDFLKRAI